MERFNIGDLVVSLNERSRLYGQVCLIVKPCGCGVYDAVDWNRTIREAVVEMSAYTLPQEGDEIKLVNACDDHLPITQYVKETVVFMALYTVKSASIEIKGKRYFWPLLYLRPIDWQEKASTVRISTTDGRPTDDSVWEKGKWLI